MKRPSMSPPESKKKPMPLNQRQSLPDDLLVSCFARVSRLYYPILSLVSKSFRSLLASQELYKFRASLGRTDSCLFVCLRFPSEPNPRWFILGHRNLFHIPIPNSPRLHSSNLIVLGSDIYKIGGSGEKFPSKSVSVLDCRTLKWHKAPSMLVKRMLPSLKVLGGNIYVRGGHDNNYNSRYPWKEVFDPKTQTWAPVPMSVARRCDRLRGWQVYKDLCEQADFRWDTEFVKPRRGLMWDFSCFCMIENVVYGYGDGVFKWYDTNVYSLWTDLEGSLPKIDKSSFVKMVNYGGKLAVLWDKFVLSSGSEKNRMIYFAVIALERRNWQKYGIESREIYGSVEWCDVVLSSVPESCQFVNALVVNVDVSTSPREASSVGETLSDTSSSPRSSPATSH